jgi:hypothetical protein
VCSRAGEDHAHARAHAHGLLISWSVLLLFTLGGLHPPDLLVLLQAAAAGL